MLKLAGERVKHKAFGKGIVTEFSGETIVVKFERGNVEKKFVYPSAFDAFLVLDTNAFNDEIEKDLDILKEKESEFHKNEEERIGHGIAVRFKEYALLHANSKGAKKLNKGNIAFKSALCDGGKSDEGIGFRGICSDEMIKYNVQVAKHPWCKGADHMCYQYLKGEMTRESLETHYQETKTELGKSICYECQMLDLWEMGAGVTQSGAAKGKPLHFKHISSNSLAILTSQPSKEDDYTRFIFAVFLVEEHFEGSETEEGFVKSNPNYRMQLTLEEAKQLKFWDFYINPTKPERMVFGNGMHRYLTDTQAAQVLKRIFEIRQGTLLESRAKQFLEYFCSVKGINHKHLAPPTGALQKFPIETTTENI